MQVFVRDNDVNSALRVLKKKMQREGTFREMKRRRAYEKPSERRVREKAEAIRRHRKMLRKRLERDSIETQAMTSEEFTQFVAGEIAKWTPVAKRVMHAN